MYRSEKTRVLVYFKQCYMYEIFSNNWNLISEHISDGAEKMSKCLKGQSKISWSCWIRKQIYLLLLRFLRITLRKKCPYSELFWSVFSPNPGKYGPGLKKLAFLVHESPCSSKQVQENVVHLVILCTLWLYKVHVFTSSCTSSFTKWNMLWKDEAMQ